MGGLGVSKAMHKEHILKLAARIEGLTYHSHSGRIDGDRNGYFAMDRYRYACGSPACIAGHAAVLAGKLNEPPFVAGAEYLGLDNMQARALFTPVVGVQIDRPLTAVTPALAASTLRHLANTGAVNWGKGDIGGPNYGKP